MIWRISLALFLLTTPALAVDCKDIQFEDQSFTACEVDLRTETLRLFLYGDDGKPYGNFRNLPGDISFAMNAGMYHDDRSPVGHYIEDGVQMQSVMSRAGPGNFGMLPNGVFCFGDGYAKVYETLNYKSTEPTCTYATQSGPMLVIDGALHPRFIEGSEFVNVRNGVGTSSGGTTAVFAISNQRVNFHTFARLFRDVLGSDNALYFDGRVSRLFAPSLGRSDFGVRLGPIVAVSD